MRRIFLNILWDFDGTLFNTYPKYASIFKQIIKNGTSQEEIYHQLKISFSHAVKYFNLTMDQINEIDRLEREISPEEVPPFPHVEEILKFATRNVIMTHKTRQGVNDILDYWGWQHYFTEMVTIDDGFPRKPHHGSYEYLHVKYSLDLVIGDRILDIIPGKKLGIKTCLFQNKEEGSDYYISNYNEFFEYIIH
jgi:HAD superfamily hydrolase (TIGR01549 family)